MGYRVAVLQNRERGEIPADITVWSDDYPGWPGSVNRLARDVVPRGAPVVVTGGDDMLPDPERPAERLLAEFRERFPDGLGVMQPHGDGFMNAAMYCGSPWLGRGWIERAYGGSGPMPSGYRHNWADNELYWVSRCLGVLWSRGDVSQRHEHFTRTGEPKPQWWATEVERRDRADVQLYIARSWQRFPGHGLTAGPDGSAPVFDEAEYDGNYRNFAEVYWSTRYGAQLSGGAERLGAALESCGRRGLEPVGIYGSGSHTRAAWAALAEPAAEVVCLIDDNAAAQGRRLFGYPIVSAARAVEMGVRAVVLSSNAMEDALWEASAPLRRAGVEVVRLYGAGGPARGAEAPRDGAASGRPLIVTQPRAAEAARGSWS